MEKTTQQMREGTCPADKMAAQHDCSSQLLTSFYRLYNFHAYAVYRPLTIQVSYLAKNGKNIEINWVLKV